MIKITCLYCNNLCADVEPSKTIIFFKDEKRLYCDVCKVYYNFSQNDEIVKSMTILLKGYNVISIFSNEIFMDHKDFKLAPAAHTSVFVTPFSGTPIIKLFNEDSLNFILKPIKEIKEKIDKISAFL